MVKHKMKSVGDCFAASVASYIGQCEYLQSTAPIKELAESFSDFLSGNESDLRPWEICESWLNDIGYGLIGFPIEDIGKGFRPFLFNHKIIVLIIVEHEDWPEGVAHVVVGEIWNEIEGELSTLRYNITHDPSPCPKMAEEFKLKSIAWVVPLSKG